MSYFRWCLFFLVFWIFLIAVKNNVFAHDHWINQEKYKAPSAAGYLKGTHCCGDKDVHVILKDIDFTIEGDTIHFLDGPANKWAIETWNYAIAGKTWPRSFDQAYLSEDLNSWITVMNSGILCVFIAYGGF